MNPDNFAPIKPAPKSLDQILPHFTVSVLPYDQKTKKATLLHRGSGVRSAKNCLAIPSGLLEHGEHFQDAIVRELGEELGIPMTHMHDLEFYTIYRNQPGDGFDWVIGVWSIAVDRLEEIADNCEPDKHDWIEHLPLKTIHEMTGWQTKAVDWAGGLAQPLHVLTGKLLNFFNSQGK